MFCAAVRSVNINSASYKPISLKAFLILSCRRFLSYRNQSIDLGSKSMYWFLYDMDLRHERVKPASDQYLLTSALKSTHFKPMSHLDTPWKRQKIFQYPLFLGSTEKFFDVFRRYRNGTLAWNGLKWTIGWKQVKVYPSQKFSAVARTDIYWITFSEKWIGLERQECILFLDIFV